MTRRVQKPDSVIDTFHRAVRKLGLKQRSILLAVSGGGDSMALLDIAVREGKAFEIRLGAACVDHGLRRASKQERALVAQAAKRRGIPFYPLDALIPRGPGIEARAREARYAALERARSELGYDLIATAHTATDQAETVLMRLSRGSALAGAAGIREARGVLVRPLLGCTRGELRAYLRRRRMRFAEDAMNRDPTFLRTRIRRSVLPALEKAAGPGVDSRLAHFAALAAEDEALLAEWAAASLRRIRVPGGLDPVGLRALARPVRRRTLALVLADEGLPIDLELIERAEGAVLRGESATLPGRAVLRAEGDLVRIAREEDVNRRAPTFTHPLTSDAEPVRIEDAKLEVSWRSDVAGAAPPAHVQPLWIPPEPGVALEVRFREPGDRVQLAGGRTRKLQDLLTDARVPREARDRVPVICAPNGRVVCVVGVWPPPNRAVADARSWILSRPLET